MNHLTKENVHKLIDKTLTPCISIYLPTEKAGKDVMKGKILLKNLLRDAENFHKEQGKQETEIKSILKPAYELVEDTLFWQSCDEGLALFISEDTFEYYKMPIKFQEKVTVADNFQIIPLLSVLTNNKDFYILSLSQKKIRLFQANSFDIEEIDLKDLPTNLEDSLMIDDSERQLQSHAGSSNSSQPVFHGHGGGSEDNKNNIIRFMQKIGDDISNYMPYKDIPLITAGVEYINSIYRETNKYPYLLKDTIEGSPDNVKPKDLRDKAQQIVDAYYKKTIQNITDKFNDIKDKGNGSEIVSDIIAASYNGQISDLVLSSDAESWGLFDNNTQITNFMEKHLPESQDMLNIAAINTLKSSGNVYVLPKEDLPDSHSQFALFRY
ncbi:MAG: Uncharacterized protein XD91_0081 [Clostridiales bacterium 38_11]|nr:MAG: Uncharacterized protein XD91_0081 [Clostridiales bacterium 38_11]HBH13666.1 hypothetical protein [Clostridiales bacterium]